MALDGLLALFFTCLTCPQTELHTYLRKMNLHRRIQHHPAQNVLDNLLPIARTDDTTFSGRDVSEQTLLFSQKPFLIDQPHANSDYRHFIPPTLPSSIVSAGLATISCPKAKQMGRVQRGGITVESQVRSGSLVHLVSKRNVYFFPL
jgi:hypothetical protein